MIILAFFLMLVVFGGIASLACIINRDAAPYAPFAFAVFFFGLGVFITRFAQVFLGSYVGREFGNLVAFVGLIFGGISCGVLGYYLGIIRRRR